MTLDTKLYKQLVIYYFSGTGNAKNASLWIQNVAKDYGLKTQVVNIDRFVAIEPPDAKEKTLIGFCSPTHGFNMPPITLKFLRKFPRLKNADVFILNTRGGLKLSKLFLPGLSGLAQLLPALILSFKGFRVVGMQPLDMPSNWLILHPALRQPVVESIFSRCQQITTQFATKLLESKRVYKALWSLPIDIALVPVAIGYYFIGRFYLAKTLVATNACNNCDKCIVQCPVDAISMVNDRPFWSYRCESCMRCVSTCHQRAIETAHSFSTVLFLLSSLVISPSLIFLLIKLGWWPHIIQNELTELSWTFIYSAIFVGFVFVSYRILHFLMRYKIIHDVIAYTSLSKYKFWRRYKPPRHWRKQGN